MALIVICVLCALADTAPCALRRRVFAQTGLYSNRLARAYDPEHMREVLEQISSEGEVTVAELRETRWLDGGRGRWCGYASVPHYLAGAMPGATMLALPVMGRIVLLCYGGWSVMNGAHRSGNLRCVHESFSRYVDDPTAYWHRFWLSHSAHRRR